LNTFISEAKNASFLFIVIMEYHNDRFDDFSVLIYEKRKACGGSAANRVGNEVFRTKD
jgi:hypothetical protein